MSRYGLSKMSVKGLAIDVHHPIMDPNRGTGLAPYDARLAHSVADYEVPANWPRASANEGSFFFGVSPDRECWFDFHALENHSHYAAVVVSVQRVNAVSGRKVDDVALEQYKTNCPKHDVPFEADRFCPECKFKWPAQNYVTNAAGIASTQNFWLDGWRTQEGEIRQFVFTDVEAGLGVAQQLIGEERSVAIGFAIYLSKNPKPVPVPGILRRGGSQEFGSKGVSNYLAASPHYNDQLLSYSAPTSMNQFSADRGLVLESVADVPRIGAPVQQEVSFGREVKQQVYEDPNSLDFWQETPAAVIMLTPAPEAWVATLTRNGPTVDRTNAGMGFLGGVQGVGTQKAG